jgi:PAS domain S-box-containing protein
MAARGRISIATVSRAKTIGENLPTETNVSGAARDFDVLALVVQRQAEILEGMAAGCRLSETLGRIADIAEALVPRAVAAVQLFDAAGQPVPDAVAPRLPAGFLAAAHRALAAEKDGEVVAAVRGGRSVFIGDMSDDAAESVFRSLALTYDIHACWIQPLQRGSGRTVGALSLYFGAPRPPTDLDRQVLLALGALARFAVEQDQRSSALRGADQRFAALADSIPGVVYQRVVTPAGDIRYTYISEGAKDLFGVSPEEILADPNALFDCHGPEYRETFRQRLLSASRELSMWDVEATIITRDGKRRFTHAIARPHRHEDGSVVWDGVILDATRIKEAEMMAAAAEVRTREAIVESLSQGFALFNSADRLVACNRYYRNLYPALSDLVTSHASYAMLVRAEIALGLDSADADAEAEDRLRQRLEMHRLPHHAYERHLADGRWLLINEHRTADGGTVILHTDVTALKDREAALERSNRELQDFAYVASHDLQEPLRKIEAFGDRLKAKCAPQLDGDGIVYLDRMQKSAHRMRRLINDLLDYSRVTTRAQPFRACDLRKVVEAAASDLEVAVEESGASVEIGDLPTIDADPVQMGQLFQNLIGNALKFRRKDKPPTVVISGRLVDKIPETLRGRSRLSGGGPLCAIAVIDNGIGFEMKYAERIFSIFQRLHGRNEYEGTGIGLATCRKIVERHGGQIWAESEPGTKTAFHVVLPVKQAEGTAATAQGT